MGNEGLGRQNRTEFTWLKENWDRDGLIPGRFANGRRATRQMNGHVAGDGKALAIVVVVISSITMSGDKGFGQVAGLCDLKATLFRGRIANDRNGRSGGGGEIIVCFIGHCFYVTSDITSTFFAPLGFRNNKKI